MVEHKKLLIKRGVSSLCFCVLLGIVLRYVYGIFSWKDGSGAYLTPVQTFYALEEDSVDVLFLGSSHCYCSVINAQLWGDYGMATYSLAISGQDLAASYYWLQEALKTQTPKVVCLDMFGVTYQGYGVKGNMYRNVLPARLSWNYLRMTENIVEAEERKDILAKWPIIHTRYTELQKEDFPGKIPLYIGYRAEFHTESAAARANGLNAYQGGEILPLGEQEKWLEAIIALARERDLELCFFVAPYAATDEEQMKLNYVKQIAEAEDIPFLNTIAESTVIGLEEEGDFIDWGHTNVWGAQKVTGYLGSFLSQNYELEDHRGEQRYALWEEDYRIRKQELDNYFLQQLGDVRSVLQRAAESRDYTICIATNGEYLREDFYLAEQLGALGIADAFYETGGTWIIGNGGLLLEKTQSGFQWYGDIGSADIVLADDGNGKILMINQTDCIKVENGINITFYDNATGAVIAMGFDAPSGYSLVR